MAAVAALGAAAERTLRATAQETPSSAMSDPQTRWQKLDNAIRGWWDGDLHRADEEAIRNDPQGTLLFLAFPYISGGGSEDVFPEIYGWDTQFTNLALLDHDRKEIVRWHILDQFSQIDRFGKMLNGNRTFYISRSQPPLPAYSVENYLKATGDEDLALRAYPSLVAEYANYWNGPSHQTPTGLSTCRDSGSKNAGWRPGRRVRDRAGLHAHL
jgi:alpha,alpha-trehalase